MSVDVFPISVDDAALRRAVQVGARLPRRCGGAAVAWCVSVTGAGGRCRVAACYEARRVKTSGHALLVGCRCPDMVAHSGSQQGARNAVAGPLAAEQLALCVLVQESVASANGWAPEGGGDSTVVSGRCGLRERAGPPSSVSVVPADRLDGGVVHRGAAAGLD